MPNSDIAASPGWDCDVCQVTRDRQPITVQKSMNKEKGKIRVVTCNVRTLAQRGKIENLIQETKRMNINVMGVAEMRWKDQGHITNNGYKVLWSGGQKLEHGVGFVLDPLASKAFKGYLAVSDRIILLKMKGPQRDLNIIQVYAPTEAAQNEEINQFYGKLEETRRKCKTNEILAVMGDQNAKVGKNRDGNILGPFGLGVRNERGDLWVDWCRNNKLIIANTWFQNHPRRLWTWQSPDDTTRNQIDFIAISERYKNGVLNCKAFPGADVGSDHVPVLATLRIKLKTCYKLKKMPKLDYEKCLKDNAVRMNLQRHFNNEIRRSHANPPANNLNKFSNFQHAAKIAIQKCLILEDKKESISWITEKNHKFV